MFCSNGECNEIKTYKNEDNGICKMITGDELCRLLDSHMNILIFDCRFDYEINAGHIKGSIPYPSEKELIKTLFSTIRKGIIIVFHCEYSKVRGVKALQQFIQLDRSFSRDNYPSLHYPFTYLLQGGFKEFYEKHKEYCIGYYRRMEDKPPRSFKSSTNSSSFILDFNLDE